VALGHVPLGMFDFASAGRHEGDHLGINDKGLVTYDRKTKKDAFFFYKANWSDDPFVHINDRRFTPRNVGTGPVKIYSNCDSVELQLNGQSLGSKQSADHIFIWPDVPLVQGDNSLLAIGQRGGGTFTDDCRIVVRSGVRAVPSDDGAVELKTLSLSQKAEGRRQKWELGSIRQVCVKAFDRPVHAFLRPHPHRSGAIRGTIG
jgi:hypothetical protein